MTPGPVEPMTLAGRFLFADRDMHSPECPRWKALGSPDAPCDCTLPEHILAIEAEAGRREAATLDRIAPDGMDAAWAMVEASLPKGSPEWDALIRAAVLVGRRTVAGEPATVPPTADDER